MKKQTLKSISNALFTDYPDIVTVKQIQQMLGCSRVFVYDLIDKGEIPALQIGVSYKIPKLSVIQYLFTCEKDSELNPDTNTWRKQSTKLGKKKEGK